MVYLFVLGIIAIVMSVPITAILTDHKRRTMKFKAKLLQDEIELERLKQENFVIETEKMKLELEQMKLDFAEQSKDLVKIEGKGQENSAK